MNSNISVHVQLQQEDKNTSALSNKVVGLPFPSPPPSSSSIKGVGDDCKDNVEKKIVKSCLVGSEASTTVHNSASKTTATKRSVRFAPTLKKKLVPHFSEYSSAQRRQIWYTQEEIAQIQDYASFEIELKQQQRQRQKQPSRSPTGSRATFSENLKKTLLRIGTTDRDTSLLSPSTKSRPTVSGKIRSRGTDRGNRSRRGGGGRKTASSLSPKRNVSEPIRTSPLAKSLGYLGLIGGGGSSSGRKSNNSPPTSPTKRRQRQPKQGQWLGPPPLTATTLGNDNDDDDEILALPMPSLRRYQTS